MFKIIWKSPRHCLCVWISNSREQMWRACVYTHAAISCGLNQTTELASPPPLVFPRPVLGSETPCKVWFSIFGPGYISVPQRSQRSVHYIFTCCNNGTLLWYFRLWGRSETNVLVLLCRQGAKFDAVLCLLVRPINNSPIYTLRADFVRYKCEEDKN